MVTVIDSSGPRAKNYGRPIHYYLPEWDDLVDPDYRFESERGTPGKRPYHDEIFAHQLYPHPNSDGLLFSRLTIEGGRTEKKQLIEGGGVHAYARFSGPIIGDCGAFGYLADDSPPYTTAEMLKYYQCAGFDRAVSIDHLILPSFPSDKQQRRYLITRDNAHDFLTQHQAGNYRFLPVGVAQGWSPQSYRDAVGELLEWGYTSIALGALARASTARILDVLTAVAPLLHPETDLHLFGVARDRKGYEVERFRQLGVTSFDSASPLRQAWLDAIGNYHCLDGKRYSALRIFPVTPSHPRVKAFLARGLSLARVHLLEQQALLAVREYDKNRLSLEATLEALMALERLDPVRAESRFALYQATLIDQPWKQCSCPICSNLGVEVILFRGNERNRRRGFHNTHVFYQRFRALVNAKS